MVNLDNLLVHRRYDPSGMTRRIRDYPVDLHAGWKAAAELDLPPGFSRANRVVVLGMGGSAVGGEVVAALVTAASGLPVLVHNDFGVPPAVDRNTLVIAVSYSGNTEETISALESVLTRAAPKIVMTSGGALRALAEREGLPLLTMNVPAPPRTTFPFQFGALAGIFSKLGMLPERKEDMEAAAAFLWKQIETLNLAIPTGCNQAKTLATRLRGVIPVIYGAGILSSVARRWKTQINENSKSWSFTETFPELVHNASVGYDFPSGSNQRVFVCMLRSPSLHPRVLVQYQAVSKLLDEKSIRHEIIDAKGETPLQQMLEMALLGDFMSYYLAILNRTDPTPNPTIDFIKKYMANTRG